MYLQQNRTALGGDVGWAVDVQLLTHARRTVGYFSDNLYPGALHRDGIAPIVESYAIVEMR